MTSLLQTNKYIVVNADKLIYVSAMDAQQETH